jgi:hypothetical protein
MPDIGDKSHVRKDSQVVTRLPQGQREEPTNVGYIFFRPEEFEVYGLRILVEMIQNMHKRESAIESQVIGLELQFDRDRYQVVGVILFLSENDYYSILKAEREYYVSRCIRRTFWDYPIVKMTYFFNIQFLLLNGILEQLLGK